MKKVLTVIAVLALISTASFAQTKFGVKLGTNFANGSGDDFEDTDSRIGMVIGGFANFSIIEEKLSFQPELLYSAQGYTESYTDEGFDVDGTLKADYLNIPLMMKYHFGGFNVQAGPQVGFLMSAKYEDDDVKDDMKGVDFGFNLGVGYDLDFGLGFDLRYNLGLSNVADYDDADGKNRVIQFTASYAF